MGDNTKSTTESKTTSGTSTTTPNAPSWATNALQDFTSKAQAFGNGDASQYVAPLTALQNQAATGAAGLGSTWQPGLATAANQAQSVYGAATPQIGSTAQSTASTYNPASYTATNAGSTGYNANLGTAAQISTDDIQRLESPYTNDVVNTTLANYDKQAAQSMAAMKAAAAANSAFSGSRYGIAEGEQNASNSLNRAQTEAGLRQADYSQALAGATTDAGFQQQTGLANQAAINAASEFGANASNTASLANAAVANAAGQFNAGAANTAGQFNAGANNASSQFNAGALNTTATNNANLQNDALARQLTSAGLLGNLSASADQLGTSDINTQAAQGLTQQQNDASYRTAGLSQLQALGALLGQGQYGLLTGQTTNGTTQSDGTSETTQNAGLGGILGGIGSGISGLAGIGGTAGLAGLFNGWGK